MPVIVLYKERSIPTDVAKLVAEKIAAITAKSLGAKIEVRVVEPVWSYNANEVHIEMRFRDFAEHTAEDLQQYHDLVMAGIGQILKAQDIACKFSFYIIPSVPPKSIWAQSNTQGKERSA